MADTEMGNPLGFTDRRRTQFQTAQPGNLAVDARYLNVGSLRTTLIARNAGYFTASRLNSMTRNDMSYALRLIDDPAGI